MKMIKEDECGRDEGVGGRGEKYTQNGGMRREGKTCEEELGTERHRMKGFKKRCNRNSKRGRDWAREGEGIERERLRSTGRGKRWRKRRE